MESRGYLLRGWIRHQMVASVAPAARLSEGLEEFPKDKQRDVIRVEAKHGSDLLGGKDERADGTD